MHRSLLVLLLIACCAPAFAALRAQPERAVDLSGEWVLNVALSEDPQAMLEARLAEERRQMERLRRRASSSYPPGAPPPIDVNAPISREPRPWQKRRHENLVQMLGITRTLRIEQSGAAMMIISDVDSRRVTAGSRSQVSMPEGQLADSNVGWDGEWFVIERRVRKGPRGVEKLRLLKNGQLEYTMAWSGDTELAGIKARRVFDRLTAPKVAPNPNLGPARQQSARVTHQRLRLQKFPEAFAAPFAAVA